MIIIAIGALSFQASHFKEMPAIDRDNRRMAWVTCSDRHNTQVSRVASRLTPRKTLRFGNQYQLYLLGTGALSRLLANRRSRGAIVATPLARPTKSEADMSERLETLKRARERMADDRDAFAKTLAAPFDRDKAERARLKFIETQLLIDAIDRAIAGDQALPAV